MIAKEALRDAVKSTVGPALRAAGFRGTYPTWRLERDGDVAVVNIWGDKFNEGSYGQFLINIAVVPAAWWAWSHECAVGDPLGSSSKEGRAQEWDGLYRSLVTPSKKREHWELRSAADVPAVAQRMTAALLKDGVPRMLDLMGSTRMLDAVRSGRIDDDLPATGRPGGRDIVLAVLLSDIGGVEFENACRRLDAFEGQAFSGLPLKTATWARARLMTTTSHSFGESDGQKPPGTNS